MPFGKDVDSHIEMRLCPTRCPSRPLESPSQAIGGYPWHLWNISDARLAKQATIEMLLSPDLRPKPSPACFPDAHRSRAETTGTKIRQIPSFRGQTKLEDLGLVTENKLARLALSRVVIVGTRQGAVTSGV